MSRAGSCKPWDCGLVCACSSIARGPRRCAAAGHVGLLFLQKLPLQSCSATILRQSCAHGHPELGQCFLLLLPHYCSLELDNRRSTDGGVHGQLAQFKDAVAAMKAELAALERGKQEASERAARLEQQLGEARQAAAQAEARAVEAAAPASAAPAAPQVEALQQQLIQAKEVGMPMLLPLFLNMPTMGLLVALFGAGMPGAVGWHLSIQPLVQTLWLPAQAFRLLCCALSLAGYAQFAPACAAAAGQHGPPGAGCL